MGVVVIVLVARRKKKIFEVCLAGRYYWLRKLATIRKLTDTLLTGARLGLLSACHEVADFCSELMRTYDLENIVT